MLNQHGYHNSLDVCLTNEEVVLRKQVESLGSKVHNQLHQTLRQTWSWAHVYQDDVLDRELSLALRQG